MKKILFFSLLMLATGGSLRAQDFIQNYSFVNAGTRGPGTSFANTGVTSFFMSWSPQTSMNTCSVQADSSSDGSSWGNGDLIASQSCTTAGSATTATLGNGKNFVRVNVTVMSGTGGLNVTLKGWGGAGGGGGSSFPLTTAAAINAGGSITVNTGGSISPAGSGTITATAAPFTGLTGSASCAQLPALTGDATTSAGTCATTLATVTAPKGGTGVASPTVHAILAAEGASAMNVVCTPPAANGDYSVLYHVTAAAAVDPTCPQIGLGGAAGLTGAATTYTVLFSDNGTILTHDKAASGAINVTLNTATTLGNPNFAFRWSDHSAQSDTITPTTWTIQKNNSAAGGSISVGSGETCLIKVDPNLATQWVADCTSLGSATSVGTLYSVGAAQSTIATASPQFFPINGANSGGAGEGNVASVIGGTGCTAKNAYVVTSNTNGAAALTITLRNAATLAGMANTALVITVGSGAAAGTFNDTTHTVSISAGTVLSWNATMGGAGLTSAQIVGIGFQCN